MGSWVWAARASITRAALTGNTGRFCHLLLVCVAGPHPRDAAWGPTPTRCQRSLRSRRCLLTTDCWISITWFAGEAPPPPARVGPHPHALPALALLAPLFSNIWLLGLAICPKQSPQRSGGVSAYPRLIRVSRWPNWWRAQRRPSEQIAYPSGPLPLNIGAREASAGSHGGGAPWVSRGCTTGYIGNKTDRIHG